MRFNHLLEYLEKIIKIIGLLLLCLFAVIIGVASVIWSFSKCEELELSSVDSFVDVILLIVIIALVLLTSIAYLYVSIDIFKSLFKEIKKSIEEWKLIKVKNGKLVDIDLVVNHLLKKNKELHGETNYSKIHKSIKNTFVYSKLNYSLRLVVIHKLLIKSNNGEFVELEKFLIATFFLHLPYKGELIEWKEDVIKEVERDLKSTNLDDDYMGKFMLSFRNNLISSLNYIK